MNIKEIVKTYLVDNGYDGLCSSNYERTCGCHSNDLCCCIGFFQNCQPAYKHKDGNFYTEMEKLNPEDIFAVAHLEESSLLAYKYFQVNKCWVKCNSSSYDKLSQLIADEINILLADKSYQMIERLRMTPKIKQDKTGVYLYTDGAYFTKRDAVSFIFGGKIKFCSWASGCNRIPYIKGFIKWCDWLKKESA